MTKWSTCALREPEPAVGFTTINTWSAAAGTISGLVAKLLGRGIDSRLAPSIPMKRTTEMARSVSAETRAGYGKIPNRFAVAVYLVQTLVIGYKRIAV